MSGLYEIDLSLENLHARACVRCETAYGAFHLKPLTVLMNWHRTAYCCELLGYMVVVSEHSIMQYTGLNHLTIMVLVHFSC
jgi:hypothetical protein